MWAFRNPTPVHQSPESSGSSNASFVPSEAVGLGEQTCSCMFTCFCRYSNRESERGKTGELLLPKRQLNRKPSQSALKRGLQVRLLMLGAEPGRMEQKVHVAMAVGFCCHLRPWAVVVGHGLLQYSVGGLKTLRALCCLAVWYCLVSYRA